MRERQLPDSLEKCDTADFSIIRKKSGQSYRYLEDGDALKNKELIERIKEIPVPATWTDVKYCANPKAYIMAIGYDGSDKLQYLYHPDFTGYSNSLKFEDLVDFGLSLPRIRRKLHKHLQQEEWTQSKLLALLVKILDKHHLRIGSQSYAKNGKSFGLTTLRKKHLTDTDALLKFEYIGKSGVDREITLTDKNLVAMLEEIAEFPGWQLFSFQSGDLKVQATAEKVNDYIAAISGNDFTAKTFRTWAGTVLAVKYYNQAKKNLKTNKQRKLKTIVVEMVAKRLGNTSAICEQYYIHPKVLEAVSQEDFEVEPSQQQFLKNSFYRKHECRVLEILGI